MRTHLTLALLAAAIFSIHAAGEAPKPNINFILTDDLGFNQIAAYGDTPIKTPNLDKLAAKGIRFTQAYAGNTVCSPSRVSLFTGRDGRLMENNSNTVLLKEIDVTMAHVLKQAGYDTALFGKYSIGSQMGVTNPLFFKASTPYKGMKRDVYDGGIHVPVIVSLPAVIGKGRVDATPWYFADVHPTFADLAGVSLNSVPRVNRKTFQKVSRSSTSSSLGSLRRTMDERMPGSSRFLQGL